MAIIDIPASAKLRECTAELQDGTVSTPFNRGKSFNVTRVFDPTWKLHVETRPLERAERQKWSAWKKSLNGGLNRFRAYDHALSRPLNYLDAIVPGDISAGWSGAGVATSVGLSGALAASGVPVGYRASIGDRVGLEQGGRYGYYEIVADAVANGSGVIALTVTPLLHTSYFSTSAVVRLWQPKALFILDWNSWSLSAGIEPSSATFDAHQVLS